MADISKEIQDFREAIYGEEVRGSMISLAEKMNEVSEATEAAEKKRVTAETGRVNAEKKRQEDTAEAIGNCDTATERANKAAQDAEDVVVGKGFIPTTEKGASGGVATLDNSGKVPDDQIPDISEKTVTFEMATKRANVQSGDSLAVAFGKLALYCADLKPHAFSNPVDNLLGTNPELPLAATQGAELYRLFNELNGNLSNMNNKTTEAQYNILCAGTLLDLAEGNFLLVGFASSNKIFWYRMKFAWTEKDKSLYKNIPTKLENQTIVVGIREVIHTAGSSTSDANVLVRVTEFYPVPDRIHFNFLNYGKWSGWKTITPQ